MGHSRSGKIVPRIRLEAIHSEAGAKPAIAQLLKAVCIMTRNIMARMRR